MKFKASVGVLLAAVCVYFVVRTPPSESQGMEAVDPLAADEDPKAAAVPAASVPEGPATDAGQRSAVTEGLLGGVIADVETKLLRVILEGINDEEALLVKVTLRGVDGSGKWPSQIEENWLSQGNISEFDLMPFFANVDASNGSTQIHEFEVAVKHPHYLIETNRVPLSEGVETPDGQTVYELRLRLVRPEYWPEFTLSVRDAHTREHLDDIEIRIEPGVGNAMWGVNGTNTLLGDGLKSPIVLMGGREADAPERKVAGLALGPATGELPRLVELSRRWGPERGVIVSVRAPGYAWASTSIDVTQGDRELLLEPAATLGVRLTNVQRERYDAMETLPMLCVYRLWENGDYSYIRFEQLDEALEAEGLWLDSLVPGEYRVTFELGGGAWAEQPLLAKQELSLVGGETRELVLTLADPPAPPERASLAGVISLPAFGGEDDVRLQLYFQPTQSWRRPDVEFALADLPRVGGAQPSWAFRAESLPVGIYRVQLLPFLKVWMIELTADGAEDLELVIPELAEVLVETVDGQTGERVPLDQFYYRSEEPLPLQLQRDWAKAETAEPGRFRFWTTPGTVKVWPRFPSGSDLEYGGSGQDLQVVPGLQSVKFKLAPVYAMHFEFREGGVALPVGDPGMYVMQNIRAVNHQGRVTGDGLQTDMRVKVSAPGIYEISFEGIDAELYHSIPPRRVEVHAGTPAKVIVELRRK